MLTCHPCGVTTLVRILQSAFGTVGVMQHRPFDGKPSINSETDRDPHAGELKPDDTRIHVREEMLMKTR